MKPFLTAKRFIAGNSLSDAIHVAKDLKSKGISVTLDHLGEDVKDRLEANKSARAYISILNRIKKEKLNANVSIKLSQIGLAIDYNLAAKNAEKIFAKAKKLGLNVEVDMENSKYVADTIALYLQNHKKYKNIIQAVQAYLYRSQDDVEDIIKSKGKIRMVKGSYNEPTSKAYSNMRDIRKNFLKLAELYLSMGRFIEIATHDEFLIGRIKTFVRWHNISQKRFEFEMLYGVRTDLQQKLVKQGYNVRVYVPYGEEWLPYFTRRIKERKENFFFALKSIFRK